MDIRIEFLNVAEGEEWKRHVAEYLLDGLFEHDAEEVNGADGYYVMRDFDVPSPSAVLRTG